MTAPPHHAHRPVLLTLRNVLIVVLVVVAVIALFVLTELDWRSIPAALQRVSRPLALLMMATLPLLGFPISAVYLAAGSLFGPWLGTVAVLAVTAVHLLVVQLLARTVLRGPIERLRNKWSHRVPEVPADAQVSLVAMLVIMPGPPYFIRNILLALAEVRWRTLFGVALPLYVVRSGTTIFLGDLGNDPSTKALVILAAIYGTKLVATVLLFRHLRHRLHGGKRDSADHEVKAVGGGRTRRRHRRHHRHAGGTG
jgi:uncharacterized membrane protein YdjX (TVP38/TMEM64 family)